MASVVIVQRVLPHYRVPFFRRLRDALAQNGIELKLFFGQEYPGTVPCTVDLNTAWARRIENQYFRWREMELVWQPCVRYLQNADLVIVEQANRLLVNYVLLLLHRFNKRPKLAYWGHGRNMQAGTARRWRESLKRRLTTNADWWFAYTAMSAETLRRAGIPAGRTTVVQNSIDVTELARAGDAVSAEDLAALRSRLQIEATAKVAVYCGGMYGDKKLDFLLEACEIVHARTPDFRLILIGDGPERWKVAQAAEHQPWIRYVGAVYGPERASYFKLGRLFLMPGLVGLAIIDSFVTQTPMVTTRFPFHSPEIAYLQDGINGVMTDFSVPEYADAIVRYLSNEAALETLRRGCAESARLYTLENMVDNFADGIKKCLGLDREDSSNPQLL